MLRLWAHLGRIVGKTGQGAPSRVVDSLNFPFVWPNFSFGRLTDAGAPWVFFEQTTPEASNNVALVGVAELDRVRNEASAWPNPIAAGCAMQVTAAGSLWSLNGKLLDRWDESGAIVVPCQPGLYLIRWEQEAGSKPFKLLVTK